MIRFAVVGLGQIGKRYEQIIKSCTGAEIVACCDIKPKDQLNRNDNSTPFYPSIEELLNSGIEIDVVIICTPNGYHASQTLLALDNKYHVVCEKPMALTRVDAEAMIQKSLQVSRNVFCVMQNRYSPPAVWLKDITSSGILGRIFMVQVNCFWNRDERYYTPETWHGNKDLDGGTLFTQFSHFIDILYWLFGDITNIKATFRDFNHQLLTDFEDSGFVTFDFVNGGIGSFNYTTSVRDSNLESSITIISENGTIKVSGQYMNKVEYCKIKNYEIPKLLPSNPPNDYGSYKGSAANHHFVIQNVVDVLTKNEPITTNAFDGLKVVDIIERIYSLK